MRCIDTAGHYLVRQKQKELHISGWTTSSATSQRPFEFCNGHFSKVSSTPGQGYVCMCVMNDRIVVGRAFWCCLDVCWCHVDMLTLDQGPGVWRLKSSRVFSGRQRMISRQGRSWMEYCVAKSCAHTDVLKKKPYGPSLVIALGWWVDSARSHLQPSFVMLSDCRQAWRSWRTC